MLRSSALPLAALALLALTACAPEAPDDDAPPVVVPPFEDDAPEAAPEMMAEHAADVDDRMPVPVGAVEPHAEAPEVTQVWAYTDGQTVAFEAGFYDFGSEDWQLVFHLPAAGSTHAVSPTVDRPCRSASQAYGTAPVADVAVGDVARLALVDGEGHASAAVEVVFAEPPVVGEWARCDAQSTLRTCEMGLDCVVDDLADPDSGAMICRSAQ